MADKKITMLYGLLTSIASKITYDNSTSGLEAENVQDAIDELGFRNDYSTTEVVIGRWITSDNKYVPIYRKYWVKDVSTMGTITQGRTEIVMEAGANSYIDIIIATKGFVTVTDTSGNNPGKNPIGAASFKPDASAIQFYAGSVVGGNGLTVLVSSQTGVPAWKYKEVVLCLEYTKSTDVPRNL